MNDGLKDKFRQTLTDIPTANPRVEWVMRHWRCAAAAECDITGILLQRLAYTPLLTNNALSLHKDGAYSRFV